jgi:hypothetical protein
LSQGPSARTDGYVDLADLLATKLLVGNGEILAHGNLDRHPDVA